MGSRFSLHFRTQETTRESETRGKKERDREEGEAEMLLRSRKRVNEEAETTATTAARRSTRRRTIASCTSPRPAFLTRHSEFVWYDEDIWTEVTKYLEGRDLVRLAMANRWFKRLVMEESIWKYACLRDLQVPDPRHVSFCWMKLYISAFDGSHSYSLRQQEKHIDWMRIGAFFFDSPVALLTDKLELPTKLPELGDCPEKSTEASGVCLLTNIKTGIWIADLQLVRCPVCNLNTCEGTMQILDARHVELFLEEEYKKGSMTYCDIGTRRIEKPATAATGVIFDHKYLNSPHTAELTDGKAWIGESADLQPKARLCLHAVAVNTNLQPNEGLNVKFQAMRKGGADGEVISIRISQQLI